MTKLIIDLSDVAGGTHPEDNVVVWSPVHREGSAGRTVSPTQHTIRLTEGKGEREVEPGPLMVQTKVRAIADTRPKEVVVPDQDTVTLWDLLEQGFTYTPPIVSEVSEARVEVREAVARVGSAEQVGEWADAAKTSETNAGQAASDALIIKNSIPQTVATEVDTQVPLKVAEAIADDRAVADAAAAAVVDAVDAAMPSKADTTYVDRADQELSNRLASVEPVSVETPSETAWAHTTENGLRLPLGYDRQGRLDGHARQIFREDVVGDELDDKADISYVDRVVRENAGGSDSHHVVPVRTTAWAHATEDNQRLPLGYSPDGRLDDYARRIFREDLSGVVESPIAGHFEQVTVTSDGYLVSAVRKNGRVYIPGLRNVQDGYSVYHRDGELLPAVTDTTRIIGWGSSTMARMAPYLQGLADSVTATYYDGGKGAEGGDHTAVRIGADPALITSPGNVIPAAGQVQVQSSVAGSSFLKPYDATVSGVLGVVSSVGHDWFFTRATPGDPVPIEPDTPAHPVLGNRHRDAVNLLNIGKNTFDDSRDWATERVITLTDNAFDWLAPLQKKSLVIGHYVNRDIPDDSIERQQIMDVMAHQKKRYGRLYVDLYTLVTTDLAWGYSGVEPTAEDREYQARGNLPPSLTEDGGHFNGVGNTMFARFLLDHMTSLGWY